jgi:putative NADPH-quinone reductase
VYGAPARRQVRNATLTYCGYRPVRESTFAPIKGSTPEARARMLEVARAAGVTDGRALVARFGGSLLAERAG